MTVQAKPSSTQISWLYIRHNSVCLSLSMELLHSMRFSSPEPTKDEAAFRTEYRKEISRSATWGSAVSLLRVSVSLFPSGESWNFHVMISDFPELSVNDILPDHRRMIVSDAVSEIVRGIALRCCFVSFFGHLRAHSLCDLCLLDVFVSFRDSDA